MTRLIPNPIGEMLTPLLRLEEAVAHLARQLTPVGSLPSIHEELVEVNKTMTLLLDEVRAQRRDMVPSRDSQPKTTAGSARRGRSDRTRGG